MSAFGLGATYGGYRLNYLKQKKREEEQERAKHEQKEQIAKAIEEYERQKEQANSMFGFFSYLKDATDNIWQMQKSASKMGGGKNSREKSEGEEKKER